MWLSCRLDTSVVRQPCEAGAVDAMPCTGPAYIKIILLMLFFCFRVLKVIVVFCHCENK